MEAKDRIEVEMEVRKTAIHIAQLYGRMGAELFDSLFLPIAKEYAKSMIDHNKDWDNPKFRPSQIE